MSNLTLTGNGSTTPLAGGATYTGSWDDVGAFPGISVASYSDVAGTLYVDFSTNASNVDSTITFDCAASSPEQHRLVVLRRYCRVRYVNGASAQSVFRLQVRAGDFGILSSALNSTIARDADAIVVRGLPSFIEIATGKLSNTSKNNKLGLNSDVSSGSVPEWITGAGGVYTGFPTGSAETLQVISSSVNDAAAGSGARTVTIFGLDANYNAISETVTLNGTTGVTTVNQFTRAHSASVITSGSSNTAFNDGTITIRHSTTTANVFVTIQPGRNQSNDAVYTVPAGSRGIKLNLRVEVNRSQTAVVSGFVWVREFGQSPRYRRPFTASNTSSYFEEPYGGLVYGPKTDIGIVVTACSANNVAIQAGFDIVIIPDD
jgi:hypothetical protein